MARWLTIPVLEERLLRRIERTLSDIRARLPEDHLIVHRTQRISSPPRKIEIEMHRAHYAGGVPLLTRVDLVRGQRRDWENLCPDLIAVAAEIASRWPEAVRPSGIALVTDGVRLWFNPGRPDGLDDAWHTEHLTGRSPCAMIHSIDGSMPFAVRDTDGTEGRPA